MDLFAEVAVTCHPGDLDDAPKLYLAPLAAALCVAEYVDEFVGRGLEISLGTLHLIDRLEECFVGARAFFVDLRDVLGDFAELFLDRFDELFDVLLSLF